MRKVMLLCRTAAVVSALVAVEARAGQPIVRYEGTVDRDNLCAFVEGFFDHLDQTVGVKISAQPVDTAVDGQDRFAGENDGALIMYCVEDSEGLQILFQGPARLEEGVYGVEGFYVVEAGGTHQGITAVGLRPVDAASLPQDATLVPTPVP